VPTVTFVTPPFLTLTKRRLAALHLPAMPVVLLPHPMMTKTAEDIEDIAAQVADEVVRAYLQAPAAA
jgi:hypothetical protein